MTDDWFTSLGSETPLALLPIRIEARYLPVAAPTQLHLRFFPDVIHVDDHRRRLNEREAKAGDQFRAMVEKADAPDGVAEAQRWLADQVGTNRALYVAEASGRDGRKQGPADGSEPIMARLLPDLWLIRIYDQSGSLHLTEEVRLETDALSVAPRLVGIGDDADDDVAERFLRDQNLAWMFDLEAAHDVGMAWKVDLHRLPPAVGTILVTGLRVDRDPDEEAASLFEQMASHRFSRGLDLVPQGTPTNNSDAGPSGVLLHASEPSRLFAADGQPQPGSSRDLVDRVATDPATLYPARAADTVSVALGHPGANAFDRVVHAGAIDGVLSWAMGSAVAPAMFGEFLSWALARTEKGHPGVGGAELLEWHARWVRGGAAIPTIRCGEQPYGVMPIASPVGKVGWAKDSFGAHLETLMGSGLDTLRKALPLPALDPDAIDSRPGTSPAMNADQVASVLAAVPHPTALQLRSVVDHSDADADALVRIVDQIDEILAEPWAPMATPQYWAMKAVFDAWRTHRAVLDPRRSSPTIRAQVRQMQRLASDLQGLSSSHPVIEATIDELIEITREEMRPLLLGRQRATQRLPGEVSGLHGSGGVGSPTALRLAAVSFAREAVAVEHLSGGLGDDILEPLRTWIEARLGEIDAIDRNRLDPAKREPWSIPGPLLVHLLDEAYLATDPPGLTPFRHAVLALELMVTAVGGPPAARRDVTSGRPDRSDVTSVDAGLAILDGKTERLEVSVPRRPPTQVVHSLDWSVREALGPSMYRLDAWVLSRANRLLAERRQKRPSGLHLGAYGWLTDVRPTRAPTSQGFIHAPSLSHATTAAVLRSGWQAFGTADGDAPLSVDLSSDRVRRGQWIMDGIRAGQDLGDLLGARFERRLHEANLDVFIEEVRRVVLDVDGSGDPPTAVVDGLVVARATAADVDPATGRRIGATQREQRVGDALQARIAGRPGASQVAQLARETADDLDAVADLLMLQSMHSMLHGDGDTASAALAASTRGDGAPPPVTATASPRSGQHIDHRVVTMLAPIATSSTPPGIRVVRPVVDAADPALASWLRSQLPPASSVHFEWRSDSGSVGFASLEDVDLDVLDAALLASSQASQTTSALGRAVTALRAGQTSSPGSLRSDRRRSSAVDVLTLDEFGVIAVRLREFAGEARALQPTDLVRSDTDTGSVAFDTADLEARFRAVDSALTALARNLEDNASPAQQRRALAAAQALGVGGALVALEQAVGLGPADQPAGRAPGSIRAGTRASTPDARERVRAAIARRQANVQDLDLPKPTPTPSGSQSDATAYLDAISGMIGVPLPLTATFVPPQGLDIDALAAGGTRSLIARSASTWIRRVGRVRPSCKAVLDMELFRSAADQPATEWDGFQLPAASEVWAAVSRPETGGDHLSVVSTTPIDPLRSDRVCGILIDAWSEVIPRTDQVTGFAVHFDAPTSRPPQTILVSVLAEDEAYSADTVADQLMATLELAKLRVAGPPDTSLGHVLPAVLLDKAEKTLDDQLAADA
ncbi:MAG: hypothetical protein AAF467_09300 [Actinomycetota bacterium]